MRHCPTCRPGSSALSIESRMVWGSSIGRCGPANSSIGRERIQDLTILEIGLLRAPRGASEGLSGGIKPPGLWTNRGAMGHAALPFQSAPVARGREERSLHRRGAHNAADLHPWPAAQRNHLSAQSACRRSRESGAAMLADAVSLSGWRRKKAGSRPDMTARQYARFLMLAPELPSLHPLDARAAQECIEITGHVFRSLRFDTTHYIPSYQEWLDREGHLEAYRFHKRFLQHLQHQSGKGRWVLKSPDHIFAMDALRQVYPDARFVFVHRDPMKVLPSVARLTEILRQPFTRKIDPIQIGRQVSDRWELGSMLLVEASEQLNSTPDRVFHVRYKELIREPFEIVSDIYRQFGLTMSAEGAARIKRAIAERPDGGYGRNLYRFEDFGLNPAVERKRYATYLTYFGMQAEEPARRPASQTKVRMAV